MTVKEIIDEDDRACQLAAAWSKECAELQTILENAGYKNVDVEPQFTRGGRFILLATMDQKTNKL